MDLEESTARAKKMRDQFLAAFSYFLGLKIAERGGVIKAIVISRVPVVFVNTLTPILPGYTAVALMRGFMSLFSMIDVPLRQSYLMGMIGSRRRASAGLPRSRV